MAQFPPRFLNQVQVLQDQLDQLLSKDWGPQQFQRPKIKFEVTTDLSQVETLNWSLPETEQAKAAALFDRLAPYFEAGFSFQLHPDSARPGWLRWRLAGSFHHGRPLPLLPDDQKKEIDLPMMSLTEIRRLNGGELLEKLKLLGLFPAEKWSTLALRPSDRNLWIVFSDLPDIFLKNHVSSLHEACLKILADFPVEGNP